MTYTITYRAKDGATRTTTVRAASREEAVAIVRESGGRVVSMGNGEAARTAAPAAKRGASARGRDAGAKGRGRTTPPAAKRSRVALMAAGGVLCAAVFIGGAWWWASARQRAEEEPRTPQAAPITKEAKTKPKPAYAASPTPSPVSAPSPTNDAIIAENKPPKEMFNGQEVVSHTYKTNSSGRSVREIIVTADGKSHGKTTVIAKPTFKYGTDQMLADVLFPPEHGSPAPLPEMDAKALDMEFTKSMLEPIAVLETDSEDLKAKKEAVKQARREVAKMMKEGYTVLDIIRSQREENERSREMKLTVAKELHRLRQEGAGAEEIKEFLEKANQVLEQRGVGPVAEPQAKGRGR